MVMEDASIIAIELGAPSSAFDPGNAAELRKSASTLSALLDAAQPIPKWLLCALIPDVRLAT